jgi:hypothetical protein
MCLERIFRIFRRKNKVIPQPVIATPVMLNKIANVYDRIITTINQYKYFINITFPTNNNTNFILNKSTYNINSEFIAYFDALINSILCKIENDPPNFEKNINIINNLQTKFNLLKSEFNMNLRLLNDCNRLVVEDSLIYTNSFKNLFELDQLPKTLEYTVKCKDY